MEIQGGLGSKRLMQLRKVLKFNTVLGITLPKEYTKILELDHGDYVEISLKADRIISIQKHDHFQPSRYAYGTQNQPTI